LFLVRLPGNRGYIYLDQGKYSEAIRSLTESIELAEQNNDDFSRAIGLRHLAEAFFALGEADAAASYADQSIKLSNKIGYYEGEIGSNIIKARLAIKNQNYQEALRVIEPLLALVDEGGSHRDQADILQISYQANRGLGRTDLAFANLEKLNAVQLDVISDEKTSKVNQLELAMLESEQSRQNVLLQAENQSKEQLLNAERRISRLGVIAGVFFFFTSLLAIFLLLQRAGFNNQLKEAIAKRTEQLQRSNLELQRFAYVASHDLRQPLTTIKGFSGLIKKFLDKNQIDTQKISTYNEKISESSDRMMSLISDTLRFYQTRK